MKKFVIIAIIILGIAILIDIKNADAAISIPNAPPSPFPQSIVIKNPDIAESGHWFMAFKGQEYTSWIAATAYNPDGDIFTPTSYGTFTFVECYDSAGACGPYGDVGTLDDARNRGNYVGETTFTWYNSGIISGNTIQDLYADATHQVRQITFYVLVIILGIAGALIGLGFGWRKLKEHATGHGDTPMGGSIRYRNLPGDKDYDSSKGSYLEGHGENVYVPPGGRIF